MKKSIIKLTVFCLVFLLAAVIVNKIMNRGHDNLTMEMAPASLPLVTLVMDGREYNQLHGYTADMDVAFQRDTVTVLGEGRDTGFAVDTFGTRVTGISIEVRSADGSRLLHLSATASRMASWSRIRKRQFISTVSSTASWLAKASMLSPGNSTLWASARTGAIHLRTGLWSIFYAIRST